MNYYQQLQTLYAQLPIRNNPNLAQEVIALIVVMTVAFLLPGKTGLWLILSVLAVILVTHSSEVINALKGV